MTTNPKRLYETERKRQQRARISAGQVHKVVVYLTDRQASMLGAVMSRYSDATENDAVTDAIADAYYNGRS